MANKDLFAQAIADAKKLKEISMANAKQAIEEAFAPRIQEMFRLKLSEMDEETMEEDIDEAINLSKNDEENMAGFEKNPTQEGLDEMTLDEILAELELEEGMEEEGTIEEGHTKADGYTGKAGKGGTGYDGKAGKLKEAKEEDAEEKEEETEEGEEAPAEEAEEVAELSVEDFKNLVRDVVADVLASQGGSEAGGEGDLEGSETTGMEGGDEAIALDEILAELQKAEEGTKTGYAHGQQETQTETKTEGMEDKEMTNEYLEAAGLSVEIGDYLLKNFPTVAKSLGDSAEQIGNMAAGLATVALPVGGALLSKAIGKVKDMIKGKKGAKPAAAPVAETAELEEAIDTIQTLKAELNEVNLLNAKLLYVNKLFKTKTLSEAQKVKVISAFDRATTIKEAKNIYATLSESLTTAAAPKKTAIKESLGFASKPIGNAPATPIVEADSYVYRMQQLAGIKKPNI